MAAAVALLLVGGLAGWFLGQEAGGPAVAGVARQAIDAHRVYAAEIRHPVEVRADDKSHLQAWLSKRVGTPFAVPDLSAEGYSLLGGRLLAEGGTPSALLMYEDKAGQRISILLTPGRDGAGSALHVESEGGLIACYWNDHGLAFAVAGALGREPMMKLAEAIYERFEG
jgi:anti-sigma factor RsiW